MSTTFPQYPRLALRVALVNGSCGGLQVGLGVVERGGRHFELRKTRANLTAEPYSRRQSRQE